MSTTLHEVGLNVNDELFQVSTHPLVRHKLTYLRQPRGQISSREYARLLKELGMLMAYEVTSDLETRAFTPRPPDPVEETEEGKPGRVIDKRAKPALIPVIRSGLIMADGMRDVIGSPYMGHLGLYGDSKSDKVIEFMVTMPEDIEGRPCIIVDPFVRSGRTACAAIRILREYNVRSADIRFVTLVMSREGRLRLENDEHASQIRFHCAQIDPTVENGGEDDWIGDFTELNYCLYRTSNKE